MKIFDVLKNGLVAGLIAALLNVVVFYVAVGMDAIPDSIILPDGNKIGVINFIISSIMPAVFASLIFLGISKMSSNPKRVFGIVGYGFLIISEIPPFLIPGLSEGLRNTFLISHIAAGVPIMMYLMSKAPKTQN